MPILTRPNDWGGSSINHTLFKHIQEILPEGKTILELGSGWGSSKLMERWNLYSIENQKKWHGKFNPQSFLVPTTHQLGWYDTVILKTVLQDLKYDLILIDGPWFGREFFPNNLDLFDTSVPMVFDDVNRELGQTVIKRVSETVGRPYEIYHANSRVSFGVV